MSKKAMKLALDAAYLAGFNASGEGYNGEYPFSDKAYKPQDDADWVQNRDAVLREALAQERSSDEQPAPVQQEPVGEVLNERGEVDWISFVPLAGTRLYTSPPAQRKPLTLQERTSIVRANKSFHDKDEIDGYGVIDDVEAAHGIKENT